MAFERVNGWMKILPGLWRICVNAFDVLEPQTPVVTRSDRRSTDREWRERDPRMDALSVLGLDQAATQDDIKQAFRRLVKRHHPDVGGSS